MHRGGGQGHLLAGTALALPVDPRAEYVDKDKQACADATDLVLQLERRSEKQAEPMPIEIVVLEEDPVPTSPPCPRASPTSPPARRVWSIRPPARP
jgi:hypothetical protein